jgi:hypothetical protein
MTRTLGPVGTVVHAASRCSASRDKDIFVIVLVMEELAVKVEV